jgi:hypothetical protein
MSAILSIKDSEEGRTIAVVSLDSQFDTVLFIQVKNGELNIEYKNEMPDSGFKAIPIKVHGIAGIVEIDGGS